MIDDLENLGKRLTREWEIWKLTNEAAVGREDAERERRMAEARSVRDRIRAEMLAEGGGGGRAPWEEPNGGVRNSGGQSSKAPWEEPVPATRAPWDEPAPATRAPWSEPTGDVRNSGGQSSRAPWEEPLPATRAPWGEPAPATMAPWAEPVPAGTSASRVSPPNENALFPSAREPWQPSSAGETWEGGSSPVGDRAPWEEPTGDSGGRGFSDPGAVGGLRSSGGGYEASGIPGFGQSSTSSVAPWSQPGGRSRAPWDEPTASTGRAPWDEPDGSSGSAPSVAPWNQPIGGTRGRAPWNEPASRGRAPWEPTSYSSVGPTRGFDPGSTTSSVAPWNQPAGTRNRAPWDEPGNDTLASTGTRDSDFGRVQSTSSTGGGRTLTREQRTTPPTAGAPWNKQAYSADVYSSEAGDTSPVRDLEGEQAYLMRPPAAGAAGRTYQQSSGGRFDSGSGPQTYQGQQSTSRGAGEDEFGGSSPDPGAGEGEGKAPWEY